MKETKPPDKNTTPSIVSGTQRLKHLSVASATAGTSAWSGQSLPGNTMFGFNSIPFNKISFSFNLGILIVKYFDKNLKNVAKSTDDIFKQAGKSGVKYLPIIVKGDVHGSVEAIAAAQP